MSRNISKFRVLILVAQVAMSFSARADDSAWKAAHLLSDQGKYKEAFERLSAAPSDPDPAAYYFNLGTIAFHLGREGQALGYLEKARRLRPHDSDIQHNLGTIREELGKKLGPERLDPASTLTETVIDHVSLEELRGVLGLIALVLSLFWIRAYKKTRRLRNTLLTPSGLTMSCALVLLVGLYYLETAANSRSPAISLQQQSVRSGPGKSFVELGEISVGMKVRCLGPSAPETASDGTAGGENWLQVRYSRDGIGWVQASGVMVID